MSDFALGLRQKFITPSAAQKFLKVLGLHWPSAIESGADLPAVPQIDDSFAGQAL
jgi:hypothetical protein